MDSVSVINSAWPTRILSRRYLSMARVITWQLETRPGVSSFSGIAVLWRTLDTLTTDTLLRSSHTSLSSIIWSRLNLKKRSIMSSFSTTAPQSRTAWEVLSNFSQQMIGLSSCGRWNTKCAGPRFSSAKSLMLPASVVTVSKCWCYLRLKLSVKVSRGCFGKNTKIVINTTLIH